MKQGLSKSKIHIAVGELTSDEDVRRIVSSTVHVFGVLDVLVSNAGILHIGTLEDCDIRDYEKVMDTNLRSNIVLAKECLPHLTKTKGNIVFVSSFSGTRPMANCLFYALSKAALNQFTRVLSVELSPKGIRVNAVNPGVMITDIHFRSGYTQEKYDQYLEDQKYLVPLGRPGHAEEVASAISFLASDMASYISGITMQIDGARANSVPRFVPREQSKL